MKKLFMFLSLITLLTLTLFTNVYTADYDSTSTFNDYDYKVHSNEAALTEVIIDSVSHKQHTKNRDPIFYYPSENDHFYFLNALPEDIHKKIITIAILRRPKKAGRLSCVCKSWNKYVNDNIMTKNIIEYMRNNNIKISDFLTAGRKQQFLFPNEITILRQEQTAKQYKASIVVAFGPTLLATVIGFSGYIASDYNSSFLIPIPVVTFCWPLLSLFCVPLIEKIYPLPN